MRDLEDLRSAIHEGGRNYPATVNLDAVMAAGRGIRRRRRLTNAAAGVVALAVAAVLAVATGRYETPPTAADRPTAAPANSTPSVSATNSAPEPWGALVVTSLVEQGREQVIYGRRQEAGSRARFGLVVAWRDTSGRLQTVARGNETDNDAFAPGFRYVDVDDTNQGIPTFGYFVGPATRIVATTGGLTFDARIEAWSEGRQVKIFWFDPAVLPAGTELDGIVAFNGTKLLP